MKVKFLARGIMLMLFLLGCKGEDMAESRISLDHLKDVPETAWRKLSEKRIFFGHQSVGFNIVDGLKDVLKENPRINLNLVETSDPARFNTPVFAHARVGKNTDPLSKVDAFSELLDRGIGNKADFVFVKFCYVDVTAETNVDKILTYYKDSMARLQKKFPKTVFIHVTAPLTSVETGFRAWVKKMIGRPIGEQYNIKRNQFNEMLKKEYAGTGLLFDLADIESTALDGKKASFRENGKTYYYLVPDYTYDGGHLNEKGRKIAAEQLLIFLAHLQ